MSNKSTIKDAVYGFAVGDALGVPFEFQKRGTFKCIDMIGNGTWNKPVGTWSDDTSMLLATCASIKKCGKIDIDDMRERFVSWWTDAFYTAGGTVFDIGGTTALALQTGRGINDINSNGNGSLMRILPLAFTDCTDYEIRKVSAITHAHSYSEHACVVFTHIAKGLIQGKSLKDLLDLLIYIEPFDRLCMIPEMKESDIRSSGYVVDTLEATLWCLYNTDNYKDAVLKAVNLGNDTDTIAAITGGLACIMYGYESIPKDWIEKLKNKTLIDACLF